MTFCLSKRAFGLRSKQMFFCLLYCIFQLQLQKHFEHKNNVIPSGFLKKKNQKSSRSYIQMKPVYIHTHIPFYRVRVFPTRDTSCALAAWRSRHSIRLRNRRLGFETRQGIRCLGRTLNCCCVYVIDLLCIFVCLLDK
jgi:hypothetical protein